MANLYYSQPGMTCTVSIIISSLYSDDLHTITLCFSNVLLVHCWTINDVKYNSGYRIII